MVIVEQRDYHVHTGKLAELVRLYEDGGDRDPAGGARRLRRRLHDRRRRPLHLHEHVALRQLRAARGAAGGAAGARRLEGVPRQDPAADPHAAEPHPRPDGVLADSVTAWASSTARSRSSRAAAQGIGRAIAQGSPRRARASSSPTCTAPRTRPPPSRTASASPPTCRRDGRAAAGRRDRRALRHDRRARQQRRPLRLARDAPVHGDPAGRVAAGDGRQRRVDVPHVPRRRAGDAGERRRARSSTSPRGRRSAASRSFSTT